VKSGTGKGGILTGKKAEAEAGVDAILKERAEAEAEAETRVKAEAKARAMANTMIIALKAETRAKARAARAKAEAKAEAEARARAKAEALIEASKMAESNARAEAEPTLIAAAEFQTLITPLHNLATDCLWLSMHFFHPIQQCAQQVYHTAIPLLPISSYLQKYSLQSIVDSQPSLVTTLLGAPDTWGLLLRTIDVRPRQLTCIATSVQGIIAACEDLVNIYDPVTFVLCQSLYAPEIVTKIQESLDGTILFFKHSFSVTMWDVQTGGLIHTFTVQSEISDTAASTTGDHLACGFSDGSITFWDIHSRKDKGVDLGDGEPVVAVCWTSPLELAVATKSSLYIHNIASNETIYTFCVWTQVWGMVHVANKGELLLGTSWPGDDTNWLSFDISNYRRGPFAPLNSQSLAHHTGQLSHPVLAGEEVVCIIQPTGVQSFNTGSHNWTKGPPLLDAAASVAVSLNRNLVAQTKDSIQIFSLDVLTSGGVNNQVCTSHVYPLGDNHIICIIQPTSSLTLLELETLRILHPKGATSLLRSLLADLSPSACSPSGHGPAAELGVPAVIEVWRSGTPLPEWTESVNEDGPLSGLSPERTCIVTVYNSPRRELRVKDAKDGTVLAKLPLDVDLAAGEVYALTFDSETRFYLKIDGPGQHVQICYDITASVSGRYSHTITKGEPVPLPEPRKTPPYTLDVNLEWVLDAGSRKICWIPPGNVRRGGGGHFWVGLSLVMVGVDGLVRKVSFREPDC